MECHHQKLIYDLWLVTMIFLADLPSTWSINPDHALTMTSENNYFDASDDEAEQTEIIRDEISSLC